MSDSHKNLRVLDALADAAADVELEEGKPTPASRAAADRYGLLVKEKLAAMRRAELERVTVDTNERRTIRADLLDKPRAWLLARLAELGQMMPQLGFAHRNLTEVTDDDLRTMIEDIELGLESKR